MTKGGKIKALIAASCGLLAAFFLMQAAPAQAGATIYFSPSAPKVNEGDVFEMGVYVKSVEQAMNACETEITFPVDKLEVLSVSSKSSIFNLMVQNPTFSNKSGVINFSGVVLNPGFRGSGGKLITLSLRAKSPGSAKLDFNSAQVLANDGVGTDILSVASSAIVNIGDKKVPEPELKATEPAQPLATKPPIEEPPTSSTVETAATNTPVTEAATKAATIIVANSVCDYNKLPAILIKVGPMNFGPLGVLIILILICIAIAIYALYKARHLEQEHHKNLHKFIKKHDL